MYAVEAVYDGVNFKPKQPIPINEPHEVVITFIKSIVKAESDNRGRQSDSCLFR